MDEEAARENCPPPKPCNDDFKEQMAARYQERLSMGFNIPGTDKGKDKGSPQKNSPDACHRPLLTEPNTSADQTFEHSEIKYSFHSYTKQPHTIRGFSLTSQDVRHNTPSKDQYEIKSTPLQLDPQIIQSEEANHDIHANTTKELIEKFESVKMSEPESKSPPDKITKSCNATALIAKDALGKNIDIDLMAPSSSLRKEEAKTTSLVQQSNPGNRQPSVVKLSYNKRVPLTAEEKNVEKEKKGRNVDDKSSLYTVKTARSNTATANFVATSTVDAAQHICNNSKYPMPYDTKNKTFDTLPDAKNNSLVLRTPTRVDLRGLVRQRQAASNDKPLFNLSGHIIESPFNRTSLRRKITMRPMDRPVTKPPFRNNIKVQQKDHEPLIDMKQQQRQQGQKQQQQQEQHEQRQPVSKSTKRWLYSGSRRLKRVPATTTSKEKDDMKKVSTAMERYLVFLKRSTPSNISISVHNSHNTPADKEDLTNETGDSSFDSTLNPILSDLKVEKENVSPKSSFPANGQLDHTRNKSSHGQMKNKTEDSNINVLSLNKASVTTLNLCDCLSGPDSVNSLESEESPESSPGLSSKHNETQNTAESTNAASPDCGREQRKIPLENYVPSQPTVYPDKASQSRDISKSPISRFVSMPKRRFSHELDSAFSRDFPASTSNLTPSAGAKNLKSASNIVVAFKNSLTQVKPKFSGVFKSSSKKLAPQSPQKSSSRDKKEQSKLSPLGIVKSSSQRLTSRSPSKGPLARDDYSRSLIKHIPEKPPTPIDLFRSTSNRSAYGSPPKGEDENPFKKSSSLTYLRRHKFTNNRSKQLNSPSITAHRNTPSPRQSDVSTEDHDYSVKELRSRYKEAKNIMKQQMQNKKHIYRDSVSLSPVKNSVNVAGDPLLLTKDDLADTELIPVHLRRPPPFTYFTDEDSKEDIEDNLSTLSSSDEDDHSNISITDRLKRIKANRLLRIITNPQRQSTLDKVTPTEDDVVRLLANFVEAIGSGDDYSTAATAKRPSNPVPPSPTTAANLCPPTTIRDKWPSNNCVADKYNIQGSLHGLTTNKKRRLPVSREATLTPTNKNSPYDLIPHNAPNRAHTLENGMIMTKNDSPAVTVKEREKMDPATDCKLILNWSPSSSALSRNSVQSLLSVMGYKVATHRSSSAGDDQHGDLDRLDLEFEEEEEDMPPNERPVIMLSEFPPDTPITVTYTGSPSRQNTMVTMGPDSIEPSEGSPQLGSQYPMAADKVPKTLRHPSKGKRKAKQEEAKRKKRKKTEEDPENRKESSVSPTTAKPLSSQIPKTKQGHDQKHLKRGQSFEPKSQASQRQDTHRSSPEYKSVDMSSSKKRPVFTVRRLTSHPSSRWPIRSSIPLLASVQPRCRADVLLQHRRCLDDLTNKRRPSKLPMASSFMQTLIDSAVEEWSMHTWTRSSKSYDDDRTVTESIGYQKPVILPDSFWVHRNFQMRKLYEIYIGVWAAVTGIVYTGYRLSTCTEDDYDIFCTEDDVTCLTNLIG